MVTMLFPAFCILDGSQKSQPSTFPGLLPPPFAICSWGRCLGLSLAWHPSSLAPWIISSLDAFPSLPLHVATVWQREGMEVPDLSPSWGQVERTHGVLFLGISLERGEMVLGAELSPTVLPSGSHSSVLGSGTKYLLHPVLRTKNQTD